MAESKKGYNFDIHGPTEKKKKNICSLIFLLKLHIKFQILCSSGSLVLQPTKGVTERRTDGPKPIRPVNFFKVGGIKTTCTSSYRKKQSTKCQINPTNDVEVKGTRFRMDGRTDSHTDGRWSFL